MGGGGGGLLIVKSQVPLYCVLNVIIPRTRTVSCLSINVQFLHVYDYDNKLQQLWEKG
jgi:hypothetical protein